VCTDSAAASPLRLLPANLSLKQPPSPGRLFCAKYRVGAAKPTLLPENQALRRGASSVWRVLSAHERAAFTDEVAALRAAYAPAFAKRRPGSTP
jgi:hypothetical protein